MKAPSAKASLIICVGMWFFLILQLFGLNWYGDWALWYYLVSFYFLTLALHVYGLGRSIFEWRQLQKNSSIPLVFHAIAVGGWTVFWLTMALGLFWNE